MPADARHPPLVVTPLRRAQILVAAGAVPPALVLGVMALLFGPIEAVLVFVVVATGTAAWLCVAGERHVVASLGARPADPVTDARLLNLIDGLCTTAGLRPPRVLVTPHDGLNLLVTGRSSERAVLAVTTGLVEHLSRIELEGVLADGLVQIRRGDIVPATIAVATFGLGTRFAVGDPDHDAGVDRAGAALTRYPPALIRALETMDRLGTAVDGVPSSVAPLWLADPLPAPAGELAGRPSGRPALNERVTALREL